MKYFALLVLAIATVSAIRFADDDALASIDSEADGDAKPAANATANSTAKAMTTLAKVTNQTYIDVTIDGVPQERMIFGLFGGEGGNAKTATNFASLCRGFDTEEDEPKHLSYLNSMFHRIIPGFMA